MEKTGFGYDITIYVKFTQEEFDLLLKAFDHSMNSSYKSQYVEPGIGAFMNANKNYFSDDSELRFTHHQIDICCKVLELAGWGSDEYHQLYNKMYNLHTEIVQEHKRITSESMSLTERAKEKLEFITGAGFRRNFPSETPNLEWVGAVLDFLEETNN